MTSDEKRAVLDAVDAAEKEARDRAEALKLSPEVEVIIYKMAARFREALRGVDTTDLPAV